MFVPEATAAADLAGIVRKWPILSAPRFVPFNLSPFRLVSSTLPTFDMICRCFTETTSGRGSQALARSFTVGRKAIYQCIWWVLHRSWCIVSRTRLLASDWRNRIIGLKRPGDTIKNKSMLVKTINKNATCYKLACGIPYGGPIKGKRIEWNKNWSIRD